MGDFSGFIEWYFGARSRINRKYFNILFFVAFIPVIYFQIIGYVNKGAEYAEQGAAMKEHFSDSFSGFNIDDLARAENIQDAQDIVREFGTDFMPTYGKTTKKHNDVWLTISDVLEVIIYLIMLPICMMRFRDMGKTGTSMIVWMSMTYIYFILKSLDEFNIYGASFLIMMPAGMASLISIYVLTTGQTVHRYQPSQNVPHSTHMPGDGPNDPY